jgi:DNA-binding phage protein
VNSKIEWDIIAHDRSAAGMNSASRNFAKADKAAARFTKTTAAGAKSAKGFSTGAALGFAAAGAAIVHFGANSVKAYAQAQQSQLKLEDAFHRFPKLADTNIESLRGLNSALAQKTKFDDDAYASGQAVLAQFDLTGQQIQQLTPLLGDYAAKTGQELPAAAGTLGKAFLGNTRALKQLGINYKSTGNQALDVANITDLLRQKVGGFAEKEGKTAAGQAEIWKNRLGELQEALGETVLKVANWAVENKGLVLTLGGIVGAVAAVRVGTKLWHVAVEAGSTVLENYRSVAGKISDTWSKMGTKSKIAVGAIAGVAAAAGVAVLIADSLQRNSRTATAFQKQLGTSVQGVAQAIAGQNGVVDENIRSMVLQEENSKGFVRVARESGISSDLLSRALLNEGDARSQVVKQLDRQIAATDSSSEEGLAQRAKLGLLKAEVNNYSGALKAATADLEYASGAAKKTNDTFNGQKAVLVATTEALGNYLAKLSEAAGVTLSAREAERQYQQAVDDASAAVKANGKTHDDNTEKGRANNAALDNLAKTSLEVAAAMNRNGASTAAVTTRMTAARTQFVRTAIAAGYTKKEAQALATKLGLIPGNYKAVIRALGIAAAKASVQGLKDRLNGLKDKNVTVTVRTNYQGNEMAARGRPTGGFQYRAAGGPVKAKSLYQVGEKGPEWFVPEQDGTIIPNDAIRSSAATLSPRRPGERAGDMGRAVPVNLTVRFSGGTDQAYAQAHQNLVRKGAIRYEVDGKRVNVA